ncbi:MAG: T9SS type A sorting domain-containing protein [Candidatus Zixiibacteriota bacterium]
MKRILLIVALLALCLPIGSALGSPVQTEAYLNNNLNFKLDSSAASIKGTRDAEDSTIATLRLSIRFTDATFQDDTLNDIYALVTFNSSLLEFKDGHRDTANWSASSALDTFRLQGTDTVRIVLKQGGKQVPKDSFMVYAYLRFYPKCQPALRLDTVSWVKTSAVTYISTTKDRINNQFYPPADTGHFQDGKVLAKKATLSFAIGSDTVTNATGAEIWVPIICSHNANMYAVKNYITWDSTKLQCIDWQGTDWSMCFPEFVSGNLFWFTGLAEWYVGESAYDTLYMLKFRLLCEGKLNAIDTIKFLDTGNAYSRQWCMTLDTTATRTSGYITRRDSAQIAGVVDTTGATSVGKTSTAADTVKYKVKLLNSFTAGLRRQDSAYTGMTVCLNLRRPQLAPVSSGYFDSTMGVKYSKETNDSVVAAIQVYDTSGSAANARPVSSSLSTMLTFKLAWNSNDGSYVPNWSQQYIKPKIDSSKGSVATGIPDTTRCVKAVVNGGLSLGTMDSIKVRMGQFYSPSASSIYRCVDQDVKVRANFTLSAFAIKVYVDSSVASFNAINSVMAGVTATRLSAYTYTLITNGSYSARTNPDTVVANFNISRLNCTGGSPDLGIRFVASGDTVRSSVGIEYQPTASHGTATATCQYFCPAERERDDGGERAAKYELNQNFPNPFNPKTRISLTLPVASDWSIVIFNVAGQQVDEFRGRSDAGVVTVEWDGGRHASGVYLYKAVAGSFVATRKMILMK